MTQSESGKKVVKAIVTDVIRDGLNSFAVARVSDIPGTVTFSLHSDREVWQEAEYPIRE